jgi:hypothetical protein
LFCYRQMTQAPQQIVPRIIDPLGGILVVGSAVLTVFLQCLFEALLF